ncbi:MAG TPA: hypothetical protein VMB34_18770 [Acetobacteraceae bacterium]|nr:hypothetical protein [Acetobacteraceae bacterium]
MIDYLIVMPLDEEFAYVRQVIEPFFGRKLRSETIGNELYGKVAIATESGEESAVLLSVGRMTEGPVQSAVETAIRTWQPAAVIMVGIAGSLDADGVRLGDVIVPSRIFGYTEAKVSAKGGRKQVTYRPTGHPLGCELSTVARAVNLDYCKAWRRGCRKAGLADPKLKPKLLAANGKSGPKLHIHSNDCLASGNAVIASKAAVKELLEVFGRGIGSTLRAVEMEAKGLCEALQKAANAPPALIVRGISDLADENKARLEKKAKDGWRRYAAQNAARFAALLVHLRGTVAKGYTPVPIPQYPMIAHPSSAQICLQARIKSRGQGMRSLAFAPFMACHRGMVTTQLKFAAQRGDGSPGTFADLLLRHADDQRILVRAEGEHQAAYTVHRTNEPPPLELLVGLPADSQAITVSAVDEFGRTVHSRWGM